MRIVLAVALAFVAHVLAPAAVSAHKGYAHYVGTVEKVDAEHIEVATEKGVVSFAIDSETVFLRKGKPAPREEATVGADVVVEAIKVDGELLAREIHFVAR